jgi:type IV pilus assembly protein PilE
MGFCLILSEVNSCYGNMQHVNFTFTALTAIVMILLKARRSWAPTGFTLVEMMVTIMIIGLLAAIAVPLYIEYAEKPKVTEAFNIIGAIISSEKLEMERHPALGFYTANSHADFKVRGLDLSETKYFTYQVTTDGGTPARTFTVTATATHSFSENPAGCLIRYVHDPSNSPAGQWSCDGSCITTDLIPTS